MYCLCLFFVLVKKQMPDQVTYFFIYGKGALNSDGIVVSESPDQIQQFRAVSRSLAFFSAGKQTIPSRVIEEWFGQKL